MRIRLFLLLLALVVTSAAAIQSNTARAEKFEISRLSIRSDQVELCQGPYLRAWADSINEIYVGTSEKKGNPTNSETKKRNWLIFYDEEQGRFIKTGGVEPNTTYLENMVVNQISRDDGQSCPSYVSFEKTYEKFKKTTLEKNVLYLLNDLFASSLYLDENRSSEARYVAYIGMPGPVISVTREEVKSAPEANPNETLAAELRRYNELLNDKIIRLNNSIVGIEVKDDGIQWMNWVILLFLIIIVALLSFILVRIGGSVAESRSVRDGLEEKIEVERNNLYSTLTNEIRELNTSVLVKREMSLIKAALVGLERKIDSQSSPRTHQQSSPGRQDDVLNLRAEDEIRTPAASRAPQPPKQPDFWTEYYSMAKDPRKSEQFKKEFPIWSLDNPPRDYADVFFNAFRNVSEEKKCYFWVIPTEDGNSYVFNIVLSDAVFKDKESMMRNHTRLSQLASTLFDVDLGSQFNIEPGEYRLSPNGNTLVEIQRGRILFGPVA